MAAGKFAPSESPSRMRANMKPAAVNGSVSVSTTIPFSAHENHGYFMRNTSVMSM